MSWTTVPAGLPLAFFGALGGDAVERDAGVLVVSERHERLLAGSRRGGRLDWEGA